MRLHFRKVQQAMQLEEMLPVLRHTTNSTQAAYYLADHEMSCQM